MQSHYTTVQASQTAPAARKLLMLSHCALFALGIAVLAAPDAFGAGPSPARAAPTGSACAEASQDRSACLREEAAARAELKKGTLDAAGNSGSYEINALARCGALPAADRGDCERRVRGEGTTSGSVPGGGVYRELVTPVPAQDNSAPAPAK
jgi:hypothetical protein